MSEIVTLPTIFDERGNLTFLESNGHIPFEIKDVILFYGQKIPSLKDLNKQNKIVFISLYDSIYIKTLSLKNMESRFYSLNKPSLGIIIDLHEELIESIDLDDKTVGLIILNRQWLQHDKSTKNNCV